MFSGLMEVWTQKYSRIDILEAELIWHKRKVENLEQQIEAMQRSMVQQAPR
jgi:hypothetical protein